ncbi:MAG TPA: sigma-70 family RNA polymerase sigma factor [Acidimicrobiia bacterium]|jgi:RNA polymerase sigma-70 factor (ECF subfamily)|nr:sigma-70 family RNA polymerase sigma factor [Acidimicrobiia bacterium]
MTSTAKLDIADIERGFDQYRNELTAYCYRMLGSAFEAEDAVQEALVRAWRHADQFEGRSSLRSWLYRIASNVCFDMLKGRQRRALPVDMTEPARGDGIPGPTLPEATWIGPIPDGRIMSTAGDPAEEAIARESVRLAFVAALQHLPARQRAVLILREVLRWKAEEVAQLLDTTVVSVNSALQRARTTLAAHDLDADLSARAVDPDQQELLARYVDAFERFDVDALVELLHEDATMQMPPYAMWMRGSDDFAKWLRGGGSGCKGSKLMALDANGMPAFAQWRPDPAGGYSPWAIHVLEISDGAIAGVHYFVDAALFPLFGVPTHLNI